MEIKKIDFNFDFNELENIDDECIAVNVTLDDGRRYSVQLITQKCLLSEMETGKVNFVYPISPPTIFYKLF